MTAWTTSRCVPCIELHCSSLSMTCSGCTYTPGVYICINACWLLTWFSYFSCCPLSCTTSKLLAFVLSSLFDRCFNLLGRTTSRMRRGGHHNRWHPQALRGGTPVAADKIRGLLQEQRHLIGSCQWVSLAASTTFSSICMWKRQL
jgi:hypothetical protein